LKIGHEGATNIRAITKQSYFMPRRIVNCRANIHVSAESGLRFRGKGSWRLQALAVGLSFSLMLPLWHAAAETVGGSAVVLVNSASAKFADFQHYIQPYLDHFGVPYSVVDISTNAAVTNFQQYAVIIVGHGQIDTNHVFLSTASQGSLSAAIVSGTGLVNFDSDLSAAGVGRYQFVQDIFGLSYGAAASGLSIAFPPTEAKSQMHFITARHATNDVIALNASMNVSGFTLPSDAEALAVSGGQPFLTIRKYGQGCAVQWASYDWMAVAVKGPMAGLDDLIWRSFVWAARKPFVIRGMPNFVTMRVDDVEGPLWWAHMANGVGLKPWIGPFITPMNQADVADLRNLVTNGNATASVHAFTASDFLYWNHAGVTNWPDDVMSNRFYSATQWHVTNGIPIGKIAVPHYSEMGANAFPWLKAWGTEFVTPRQNVGTPWGSPWIMAGPYRLYETPQNGFGPFPLFYADFLAIPGHPELAGQFFLCTTVIADDASCNEWCPSNDVGGSIGRGTRQLKRALDGMALATLFTHEWYIHATSCCGSGAITTNNWQAILQGITNNLAAYNLIYVTLDYACQYVRATRTARVTSSEFDQGTGQVNVTLSGSADIPIQLQIFVGEDNGITNLLGTVPAFSGSLTLTAATLAPKFSSVAALPDRTVQLSLTGLSNFSYRIDGSTDFLHWGTLTSFPNLNGTLQFIDSSATNFSSRFYRAVWIP
jgi:hypothetical protein